MRVEWREVLPASRSVADSRQVSPGGIVRLQQTTHLGLAHFLNPAPSTCNLHPIAHHRRHFHNAGQSQLRRDSHVTVSGGWVGGVEDVPFGGFDWLYQR